MDGPMTATITMRQLPDARRTSSLTTDELRAGFLIRGMFTPGDVVFHHVDLDRVLLGGAVPVEQPLRLEAPASLAAEYLTERRELGILNIGEAGSIAVDGRRHVMQKRDMLYVGRGSREIVLASDAADRPARFYLVSYSAHTTHPTTRIGRDAASVAELGTGERANRRNLAKYIYPGAVASAQLVMGVTELQPGSVWNTMPAHTHARRTEVYLYFDLPENAVVIHLMGEPHETRHLVVRNDEVVLSPNWSIHSGCGTSNYSFCWAMGGENQDFADMQAVDIGDLR
jgi:4-deoxy-L-threo-5-hexosulose-uronate ketol-isomerase